jgi:hypothetical protein
MGMSTTAQPPARSVFVVVSDVEGPGRAIWQQWIAST